MRCLPVMIACVAATRDTSRSTVADRGETTGSTGSAGEGEQSGMKRILVLGVVVATALTAGAVLAETCLSPYIKGLRQPETVMYLWTLPAGGRGSDYLTVIDVNLPSPTYAKILEKVEVGSIGNEAHHMGFTDDRAKIWAASLNT